MQKRHFEAIAEVIRSTDGDEDTLREVASRLAEALAGFNPLFSRHRFLVACGLREA